jgi:hypothetical protein
VSSAFKAVLLISILGLWADFCNQANQSAQFLMEHATNGTTLADLLERILDKGIVIAGDIKVKIVDIELLSIQIRLVVCSVDKAKEMGIDWWVDNPAFAGRRQERLPGIDPLAKIEERLVRLEAASA